MVVLCFFFPVAKVGERKKEKQAVWGAHVLMHDG
jgi:hypothetical protein